jgi:hypothetical protein
MCASSRRLVTWFLLLVLAGCATAPAEVVAPDAEARGEKPGKPKNVKVYEPK